MAKTPEAALDLMMKVWPKAVQRLKKKSLICRSWRIRWTQAPRSSLGIIASMRRRFAKPNTIST